jgi:hypothetical protein
MKKIKTTDITVSSAMPLKKGSLDHLQAAYIETIEDVNKAYWAGDRVGTQPMALHGLINSGSGSTYTISAGALMLDTYAEVFRCDAQTVVVNVGQVLVGNIVTTYLTTQHQTTCMKYVRLFGQVLQVEAVRLTIRTCILGIVLMIGQQHYRVT